MIRNKHRISRDPFTRDDKPVALKLLCRHLTMADGFPRCKDLHKVDGKHPFCVYPMMQTHCQGFEKIENKTKKTPHSGRR